MKSDRHACCAGLGITEAWIRSRGLRAQREARRLVPAGLGTDGRDKFLTAEAAGAWQAMQAAALDDGIGLLLISAFRSLSYQTALIQQKLDRGRALEDILKVNAPPGYSEHHTGRAIDIGTSGVAPLDEAFERTPAFDWLHTHAARFGFRLSYPRGNPEGFVYEPWHWCFHGRKRG